MRKSTKKLYRQVGASVVVLVILVAVAGMPMASGATTEEAARQPSGQASSTTEASATPGE